MMRTTNQNNIYIEVNKTFVYFCDMATFLKVYTSLKHVKYSINKPLEDIEANDLYILQNEIVDNNKTVIENQEIYYKLEDIPPKKYSLFL